MNQPIRAVRPSAPSNTAPMISRAFIHGFSFSTDFFLKEDGAGGAEGGGAKRGRSGGKVLLDGEKESRGVALMSSPFVSSLGGVVCCFVEKSSLRRFLKEFLPQRGGAEEEDHSNSPKDEGPLEGLPKVHGTKEQHPV